MTRYDIGSRFTDRNVYVEPRYDGAYIGIKNTYRSTEEFAYLTPEQAYKLADWITANVERPKAKTAWDHWTEFPVGTVVTVTSGAETYVKATDDLIKWTDEEGYPASNMGAWRDSPYDLIREIYRPAS